MDEKIKLPSNVLLIDAAFLNLVVTDLKKYFEKTLMRELQEIDLSELVTYIVLDAGMAVGDNQIQILMVYDKDSAQLSNCRPSDLSAELNGVAFKSQFGEFSFASVPCEEMVSREELYLDLLSIVLDSADVERLILVSFNEEYGDKVMERLKGVKNKETIQFRMNEPEESIEGYQWEMLAYPVMQALGIRGEEL
ncbi:DUF6621 family protein [Bacteroides fragilis]|uniref:L-selectin n=1 Tax=Bacteroides fragilis TaxID=817 RepID=A0A853PYL8_BACFG|nr:DUF6621 family protein [Bacteroides fragilis]EYA40149.1 putative l-selectin [Bacteroides fragilis str. 20793-3]MCS2357330.1 hypothetical protein [Bacteroides fragilis]OCR34404.1 hypothetical protein AC094_12510 [Bacteroides fragilis]PJY66764.1 hypothetical protein CQW35_01068 [Bacteroides fragilis]